MQTGRIKTYKEADNCSSSIAPAAGNKAGIEIQDVSDWFTRHYTLLGRSMSRLDSINRALGEGHKTIDLLFSIILHAFHSLFCRSIFERFLCRWDGLSGNRLLVEGAFDR
jgi:hypothetical protein